MSLSKISGQLTFYLADFPSLESQACKMVPNVQVENRPHQNVQTKVCNNFLSTTGAGCTDLSEMDTTTVQPSVKANLYVNYPLLEPITLPVLELQYKLF